jgi:hypothetical protein
LWSNGNEGAVTSHCAYNVAVQTATVDRYGRLVHGRTLTNSVFATNLTSYPGNKGGSDTVRGFDGVTERSADGTMADGVLAGGGPKGHVIPDDKAPHTAETAPTAGQSCRSCSSVSYVRQNVSFRVLSPKGRTTLDQI